MFLADVIKLTPEQYELAKAQFIANDEEMKALKKEWPKYLDMPDTPRYRYSVLGGNNDRIGTLFWGRPEEKWIQQSEKGQELKC